MTASTSVVTTAAVVECGLLLCGVAALWHAQFNRATAARRHAPALPAWPVTPFQFLAMAFCVIMGAFFAQSLASIPVARLPHALTADAQLWNILRNSSLQFGLLAGVFVARLLPFSPPPASPQSRCLVRQAPGSRLSAPGSQLPALSPRLIPLAALATFLIAQLVATVLGYVGKLILPLFGVSVAQQGLLDTFRDIHSRPALIFFIVAATVLAPVIEETVFRAGLFRYLRTRVPRWFALLIPAALFALLHGNALAFLPLMALAVAFSIAYERTGRISVTILAHGLFNLHTILLILAGVTR